MPFFLPYKMPSRYVPAAKSYIAAGPKYAFRRRKGRAPYRRARYSISKRRTTRGYKADRKELKFHDVALFDTVVSSTAAVTTSLNLIAQGITEDSRIGRNIVITKISTKLHFFLVNTTNAADTHEWIKVFLVLDTQCNGANPANSDILEDVSNEQTFRNLANSGRFQVLWTRTANLVCPSGGTSSAGVNQFGSDSKTMEVHKNVSIPIQYDLTDASIGAVTTNNLFYIFHSRHNIGGIDTLTRIRFTG